MAYFHGPWFVTPKETSLAATHSFFKQEALLSTISDSNPLLSIVGKSCVLETKDYTASRPTQYREPDCFICESVYDESKRAIRGPIESGLKQYEWAPGVQTDEIYFFKNPISVQKVICEIKLSYGLDGYGNTYFPPSLGVSSLCCVFLAKGESNGY